MYIPELFNVSDLKTQQDFMRENSFASVVTTQNGKPVASHLPLYLDGKVGSKGALLGHMARANPQWQSMQNDGEVLVIFQGAHAYVSPSWYKAKEMVVPTWNYMAVHAYGKARLLSLDELVHSLHTLVTSYERPYALPWQLEMTELMRENMLGAIVGFEIVLGSIEGKFKLNQNRSAEDRAGVVAQLSAQTNADSLKVAEQMKKYSGEC